MSTLALKYERSTLMMEQSNALLHKGDAKLLCRRVHIPVIDTSTRCGHVLHPRPRSTVDIVGEGKLAIVSAMILRRRIG